MMTNLDMIVVAWCLSVGLSDLYRRHIPNILTIGACLIAVISLLFTGHALLGAHWQSVALGTAISLLLTFPAYAARLLGAGDVKLLLAIAMIAGWHLTLFAFVIASILAMLFGVTHILFARFIGHQNKPKRWIPFGAALSAGLVCAIGMAK
jgi:Flp pilus assembly protein protease CpaA